LNKIGIKYSVIGDAKEVRNIYEVIKDGYEETLKYAG